MTSPNAEARVEVHEDATTLATAVAGELLDRIADAQASGAIPNICLTGGTIAEAIHREVARLADDSGVDWGAVEFWFGDERFVAPDSPDRNAGQAKAAFLDEVGVPAHRIHQMPSTAEVAAVTKTASRYAFNGTPSVLVANGRTTKSSARIGATVRLKKGGPTEIRPPPTASTTSG